MSWRVQSSTATTSISCPSATTSSRAPRGRTAPRRSRRRPLTIRPGLRMTRSWSRRACFSTAPATSYATATTAGGRAPVRCARDRLALGQVGQHQVPALPAHRLDQRLGPRHRRRRVADLDERAGQRQRVDGRRHPARGHGVEQDGRRLPREARALEPRAAAGDEELVAARRHVAGLCRQRRRDGHAAPHRTIIVSPHSASRSAPTRVRNARKRASVRMGSHARSTSSIVKPWRAVGRRPVEQSGGLVRPPQPRVLTCDVQRRHVAAGLLAHCQAAPVLTPRSGRRCDRVRPRRSPTTARQPPRRHRRRGARGGAARAPRRTGAGAGRSRPGRTAPARRRAASASTCRYRPAADSGHRPAAGGPPP